MRARDVLYGNSPAELLTAAVIAGAVLLLVGAVRWLAARKLKKARETATDVDDFFLDVAHRTKLWLLILPAVFLGARALTLPRELGSLVRIAAAVALITQTALWAAGLIDFWLRRYRRVRLESDPAAVMTVNIFRVAAVATVWLIAALVTIEYLGFNITTLIAGLGIGGVAVALAIQSILGDLFASLSIVIDKPFVLGDTITVDTLTGTVEHIGLKTTRLRSVSGEEIIFSNGDLLKSRIRNYKRVTERRVQVRLGVAPRTPVETLERIPTLLRAAVEKQEKTRFENAHFVALGPAYEFELVYHVAPDAPFENVRQSVNLDVVRALAEEKVELAGAPRPALC